MGRVCNAALLAVAAASGMAAAADGTAQGSTLNRVAAYGSGLDSCQVYSAVRTRQDAGELIYINWLTGYISAANATSRRRNNLLGPDDFRAALYWLDQYCATNPGQRIAQGSGLMMMGRGAGMWTHAVDNPVYGPGLRSASDYLSARRQRDEDEHAFLEWLAGYLSGANLMLMNTSDLLGSAPFSAATDWLDAYCTEHPATSFAEATAELVEYFSIRPAPKTAANSPPTAR